MTTLSQLDLFLMVRPLVPLFVVLLVVWLSVMLLRRFLTPRTGTASARLPRVQVNRKFISYAEADFYRVLRQIVGDKGLIFAQVSLGRLLWFPGNNRTNPGRGTWWNKVSQKSIDFVIVDQKTLRPMLAIELNDSSHERENRKMRDEDVRAITEAAGLRLIWVEAGDQRFEQAAEEITNLISDS